MFYGMNVHISGILERENVAGAPAVKYKTQLCCSR